MEDKFAARRLARVTYLLAALGRFLPTLRAERFLRDLARPHWDPLDPVGGDWLPPAPRTDTDTDLTEDHYIYWRNAFDIFTPPAYWQALALFNHAFHAGQLADAEELDHAQATLDDWSAGIEPVDGLAAALFDWLESRHLIGLHHSEPCPVTPYDRCCNGCAVPVTPAGLDLLVEAGLLEGAAT
jgi:hypothetical protein